MIDWHYPRTELAKQYMDSFDTGITGALALFAPRRMGKTEFVLMDLAEEAESRGYQVGYCSFWNLQDNPAKALKLALLEINRSSGWKSIWKEYTDSLSSEISASVGAASLKLKAQPIDKIKEDDLLAIIDLIERLSKRKKPTLLLLDEVQHLSHEKYASLVATMRTQLDKHRKKLHVVFTGSSRDGLQRMFRDRKAPMFHAAQQVDFPNLDSKFVAFMLNSFGKASHRKLSQAKSIQVFKRMNQNPALFHHLLRHMVIKGIWDIGQGYDNFRELVDVESDYQSLWESFKPIDVATLKYLVTTGRTGIYSDYARKSIGEEIGIESVTVKTIQNSVKRLRENQVLYSPARGEWLFEDPQFKEWVLTQK